MTRGVDLQRPLHRLQDRLHRIPQRGAQRGAVGEFAAGHPAAQVGEDPLRCIDTDVGRQQAGLDLVEQLAVDGPARQEVAEPAPGPGQLRTQSPEKPG